MAKAVRSWYIAATPEIGISAIEGAYGFLVRSDRGRSGGSYLVDSASSVRDALAEATEFFGPPGSTCGSIRGTDLGGSVPNSASLASRQSRTPSCSPCGSVRAGPGPEGLRVEDVVDEDGLREWATVKLRGFADSGSRPRRDRSNRRCRRGRPSRLCVATNWPTWALNQFPCSATTRVGTRWCSSWPLGFRFDAARSLRTCSPGGVNKLRQSGPGRSDQLRRRRRAGTSVPAHRLHRRGLLAPPVPETDPPSGVDAQRLQPGVRCYPRCRSSIVTAQQRSHPAFGATWAGCSRRALWDTVPPRARRADRRIRAPSCSPTMRAPSGLRASRRTIAGRGYGGLGRPKCGEATGRRRGHRSRCRSFSDPPQ